ncbi:MAG: gamma-glutamyl-gamma-aminobutyrate hydrolase family protein [Ignavibacteriales bacterium]
MTPVVGITCAWSVETWQDEAREGGYTYAGSAYPWAVQRAGGMPLMIPHVAPGADPAAVSQSIVERLDGLVVSGGGGARIAGNGGLPPLASQQPQRYDFESALINKAVERGIPIIGICRGHQMITEVFGGSVSNIIPADSHMQIQPAWEPGHLIDVEPGTLIGELCGCGSWDVTSFHRQAVSKVPSGFRASAFAPDGTIEAIESAGPQFIVGLQFHPEYLWASDEKARKLFCGFIDRCRGG